LPGRIPMAASTGPISVNAIAGRIELFGPQPL
jgi:hypothetical protein